MNDTMIRDTVAISSHQVKPLKTVVALTWASTKWTPLEMDLVPTSLSLISASSSSVEPNRCQLSTPRPVSTRQKNVPQQIDENRCNVILEHFDLPSQVSCSCSGPAGDWLLCLETGDWGLETGVVRRPQSAE